MARAVGMDSPVSNTPPVPYGLPAVLPAFLAAAGWGDAIIEPLAGDASFRRYFRLRRLQKAGGDATAMLMDAPPPHEDPRPFLAVARWLEAGGMRSPRVLAEDASAGLVLLEDFGQQRMRDHLDVHPADELVVYEGAVDALVALHRLAPGPFAPYDQAVYAREAALFTEWFCPARGLQVDAAGLAAAWQAAAWGKSLARGASARVAALGPGAPRR